MYSRAMDLLSVSSKFRAMIPENLRVLLADQAYQWRSSHSSALLPKQLEPRHHASPTERIEQENAQTERAHLHCNEDVVHHLSQVVMHQ
jgi:hypothetical protein